MSGHFDIAVIPAKAGRASQQRSWSSKLILLFKKMDSGFRRNDERINQAAITSCASTTRRSRAGAGRGP
jgi:hypothetical protein